jgi:hypothetical protein
MLPAMYTQHNSLPSMLDSDCVLSIYIPARNDFPLSRIYARPVCHWASTRLTLSVVVRRVSMQSVILHQYYCKLLICTRLGILVFYCPGYLTVRCVLCMADRSVSICQPCLWWAVVVCETGMPNANHGHYTSSGCILYHT